MQRPITSPHSKCRDPPTPPFDYSTLKMCLGKIFGVELALCFWSGKGEVGGGGFVAVPDDACESKSRAATHAREK
jgi:hypothetical protein